MYGASILLKRLYSIDNTDWTDQGEPGKIHLSRFPPDTIVISNDLRRGQWHVIYELGAREQPESRDGGPNASAR